MTIRRLALALLFAAVLFSTVRERSVPSASSRIALAALTAEAKNQIPSSTLLPVQSKNPDDLSVGKLLVASRDLGDPIFAKTVILLVHYNDQGVLGLMLNRRTKIPVSQALDQFKAAKDRSDLAYLGGPVETPTIFALMRSQKKIEEAQAILKNVYLVTSKSLLEKVISTRPRPKLFHVYLGYAGWTKKQLQQEIALGGWFISPADARTIFDSDPDALWREMIRKTELKLAANGTPEFFWQPALPTPILLK